MLKNLLKTFQDATCISKSKLWPIITDHYKKTGISAWDQSVPYIVTNTTLCAQYHARAINVHAQHLPYKQHSYIIIDYGAGIGQHTFHLAKALMTESLSQPLDMFVIYMADVSNDCLDFWKNHPQLQPFIDSGLIKPVQLSGEWLHDLKKVCLDNHPHYCLIANYLLDSMPFMGYEHHTLQSLSLQSPRKHLTPEFSGPLDALKLKLGNLNTKTHHTYPNLLKRYQKIPRYTIPSLAIDFIQQFFHQNPDNLMLINDKMFLTPESFNYDESFNLNLEGNFSTTVNMDSVAQCLPSNTCLHTITQHYPIIQTVAIGHIDYTPPTNPSCSDGAAILHFLRTQSSIPNQICLSIAPLLHHDSFCLEVFSQTITPDQTKAEHTQNMIEACLEQHFHKPSDYILLHASKMMRRLGHYALAKDYLKRYQKKHITNGAYHLEAGILAHCMNKHSEALEQLTLAAQDPITAASANTLIQQMRDTVNE